MRRSLRAALAVAAWNGAPRADAALAEPVRAVVEMYTSQGCAACPSADRFVADLSREGGVLALTVPVTYWDYLGWRDSLASAAFTDRQRGYASGRSERTLFTPEAVVNGGLAVLGSDRAGIRRSVADAKGERGRMIDLHAQEQGDRIVVDVEAGPEAEIAQVWLVPILRSRAVAIGEGENKGLSNIYTNVVRGLLPIGAWVGRPARFEVPREAARKGGADTYAIMLQNVTGGRPGRILGAAKGPGL